MLAVLVVIIAVSQGVYSQGCPEITSTESRTYPVGSTLELPCPGTTTLTYTVTCQVGSLWDFSLAATACVGQAIGGAIPTTTVAAPRAVPATFDTVGMMCPYLPGFMKPEDAGKSFPQGRRYYDMRCQNGAGTFSATCRDKAWVYNVDSCKGVVQPPRPDPPVVTPGPTQLPPGYCPFFSGYMEDKHSSMTFPSGSIYLMTCNPPNQDKFFEATCTDGTWYGNVAACTSSGGLLGGLFSRRSPSVADPQATIPPANLKECGYQEGVMDPAHSTMTFPHGTEYRFDCLATGSVVDTHAAICNDGTWDNDPNDCYRRQSTSILDGGITIGNTKIPIWFFLLG